MTSFPAQIKVTKGKLRLKDALENNWIDVDDIFPDLPGLVMRMQKQRKEDFDFYTMKRAK